MIHVLTWACEHIETCYKLTTVICTAMGVHFRYVTSAITTTCNIHFSGVLVPYRNFARCKIHFASKSCVLLSSVTARHSSSGRQPNFAALKRGRHLYSAGRPLRWAVAHILVTKLSNRPNMNECRRTICKCAASTLCPFLPVPAANCSSPALLWPPYVIGGHYIFAL